MGAAAFLAIGLMASTSGSPQLVLRHDVQIQRRQIQFGDVADVSGLPTDLQAQAAALPIANLPAGKDTMVFSARSFVERARAQAPVLARWLPATNDGAITVHLRGGSVAATDSISSSTLPSCLRLVEPVAAGAIPKTTDFVAASCDAPKPLVALKYDRDAGAVRATRNLQTNELIASASAFAIPAVRPGQDLVVEARVGPVVVQRTVKAAQAAQPGQRLFVQTADHEVFSALLPANDRE
jgi:hypothetical protein